METAAHAIREIESPAAKVAVKPDVDGPLHIVRMTAAAKRQRVVLDYLELKASDPSLNMREAARRAGVAAGTLCKWLKRHEEGGLAALLDNKHKCGAKLDFPALTEAEELRFMDVFARNNLNAETGSMLTAAKFCALDSGCRQEVRDAILPALERGTVPLALQRVFERVTPTHIAQFRRPRLTSATGFSGNVGAFVQDKIQRLRVLESDDGTINFSAWIPWEMGGDPCSDKFRARVGRWQFLPAIDAGWTHMYLGYALVCRPRGSYRKEDIRSLFSLVFRHHGLPDKCRLEHGAWESDEITTLLRELLGPDGLVTVDSPNHKPYIEGGFNVLWQYLSLLDGQMGRYRGDEERGNLLLQKCRAGRADPRDHFPSLSQAVKALDGALAMRNSDTVNSIYGKWVPEVRYEQLKAERPPRPLDPALEFLFSPFCREWTVAKGTVGGDVPILEDFSAPFYFAHDELWRWNGHKVRLYFDPRTTPCVATILATETFHGYRPNEVICRAELLGGLPHFCRAARGWADEQCERQVKWRSAALSALRTDLRALGPRGQVMASVREERDGSGSFQRTETSPIKTTEPVAVPDRAKKPEPMAPTGRGGFRLAQILEDAALSGD